MPSPDCCSITLESWWNWGWVMRFAVSWRRSNLEVRPWFGPICSGAFPNVPRSPVTFLLSHHLLWVSTGGVLHHSQRLTIISTYASSSLILFCWPNVYPYLSKKNYYFIVSSSLQYSLSRATEPLLWTRKIRLFVKIHIPVIDLVDSGKGSTTCTFMTHPRCFCGTWSTDHALRNTGFSYKLMLWIFNYFLL